MSAITLALEYLKLAKQYGPPMAFGNTTIDDAIAAIEAETGEPVAWGMTRQDGLILDVICPKEHARYAGAYTIPLYTAQPPAVPQGWKLVPIEPTPEMWKAGLANLFIDIDAVWAAMLEKAPKAPA